MTSFKQFMGKMKFWDKKADTKSTQTDAEIQKSILTEQQKKDYDRDGFLLIPGFLHGEKLEKLKQFVHDLQQINEKPGLDQM